MPSPVPPSPARLGGDPRALREARHRVPPRADHPGTRPGTSGGGVERRRGAAVRPLPRCAPAPRPPRRCRRRTDRRRLDPRRPVDPRDVTPRRVCAGRHREHRGPKAGAFAEGQAEIAATRIAARLRGEEATAEYSGAGACYLEFGERRGGARRGRVHARTAAAGRNLRPTAEIAAGKVEFAASRIRRWFGRPDPFRRGAPGVRLEAWTIEPSSSRRRPRRELADTVFGNERQQPARRVSAPVTSSRRSVCWTRSRRSPRT